MRMDSKKKYFLSNYSIFRLSKAKNTHSMHESWEQRHIFDVKKLVFFILHLSQKNYIK